MRSIREVRERVSRAIQVLRVDLANGHDLASAIETIATALGMDNYEHFAFRKVAFDLKLDKVPLPIPPRLRLRTA